MPTAARFARRWAMQQLQLNENKFKWLTGSIGELKAFRLVPNMLGANLLRSK
jgi:hypothetical protein